MPTHLYVHRKDRDCVSFVYQWDIFNHTLSLHVKKKVGELLTTIQTGLRGRM